MVRRVVAAGTFHFQAEECLADDVGFRGERCIVLAGDFKTGRPSESLTALHQNQFGREPVKRLVVDERFVNPPAERAGVVQRRVDDVRVFGEGVLPVADPAISPAIVCEQTVDDDRSPFLLRSREVIFYESRRGRRADRVERDSSQKLPVVDKPLRGDLFFVEPGQDEAVNFEPGCFRIRQGDRRSLVDGLPSGCVACLPVKVFLPACHATAFRVFSDQVVPTSVLVRSPAVISQRDVEFRAENSEGLLAPRDTEARFSKLQSPTLAAHKQLNADLVFAVELYCGELLNRARKKLPRSGGQRTVEFVHRVVAATAMTSLRCFQNRFAVEEDPTETQRAEQQTVLARLKRHAAAGSQDQRVRSVGAEAF